MRAVIIDAYGDNGVVRLVEVERPRPGAGEVLVRIRAAGVNPVDWKIRGGAGQRMGMTLPIRLGGEIAGTVEEVGEGVDALLAGDAVYGMVKSGGFADYAVARAADVARKPANLDVVEAAAVPIGALTAWQALVDLAGLAAGQRLLVTNASGTVGAFGVQIAKLRGAHVTAMASGRNAERVRGLGADAFIDRVTQRFDDLARDMDVVFDTVGGDTFQRAFRTLRTGGVLVTAVAFPAGEARQHGVRAERVLCRADAGQLAAVRDLVEAGRLRPHVGTVLPLAEVRRALEMSEGGQARGKIVLSIAA